MRNNEKNERDDLIKKVDDNNVIYLSRDSNKKITRTLQSFQQSLTNYYYKKFYFSDDTLFQITYDKHFRPSTYKLIINSDETNKMSIENIISLNRKYSDFLRPVIILNEENENNGDLIYIKKSLQNGLYMNVSNALLPLTILGFTFLKYYSKRNQDRLFRNFMLAVTFNIISNYYLSNKIANFKHFELPRHLKIKYEKEISIYKSFYNLDGAI